MSTNHAPKQAMILAAGIGRRLLPITKTCPKPLVTVGGQTLLDRILDRLEAYGIEKVVINTCYLGEKILAHFKQHPRNLSIVFSQEEVLLDTGGGVKRVLDVFEDHPFFVINGDVLWKEKRASVFELLTTTWVDDFMDGLLLLVPLEKAWGYDHQGDFFRDANGCLAWRGTAPSAPYVFSGIQLIHPRAYKHIPDLVFSNSFVWDHACLKGRLYGAVWEGPWFHIGTPEALEDVQTAWSKAST